MSILEGRRALVTGGGRGIGASVARGLAAEGAHVVVVARTASEIRAVARKIRKTGGAADPFPCDVSSPDGVEAMAREVEDRFGPVDVLVNNAGVAPSARLHRTSTGEWERTMAVNAGGTFLCTRAVLPGMLERGWGRVVNVASVAGLTGDRYISAYAASKHAVVGLTRCLAAEVAGRGITANAVCPGYVDSPMTDASVARIVQRTGRTRREALEAILATTPQNRLVRPDEVAHAVLSLCPDAAESVNGVCFVVDGGALRR